MNDSVRDLLEEYTAALQEYLAGAGEPALQAAYQLGRRAIADGLGVLEMAALDHEALVRLLPKTPGEIAATVEAAKPFAVESLTPFEMAHRGFREANTALQASEERYRELFENANDIVFTLDLAGNFTSVNRAGERASGYTRDEILGMNVAQVVAPEHLGLVREMQERRIVRGRPTAYELEVVAKGGPRIPLEINTRIIWQDSRPVGVQGIARDITERKGVEEARRRLNEQLEEQAKQIAHALHDEAGQLLAAVYIAVEEVACDVPRRARERLGEIKGLLDQIEAQLRRLSHELRPTILDDLGLLPALEFLAERVSARTGLPVNVEGSTEGRLPAAIETALYRTAQEAMTNVAKHAQAKRLSIRIERGDRMIRCSIRDDGVGFNVPVALARRGMRGLGLIGIRERIDSIGGILRINSAPGCGTELLVSVPLET